MPQGGTTPDASGVTVAGRGVGVCRRGLSGTRAAHYGGSCVWGGQQRICCERASSYRIHAHVKGRARARSKEGQRYKAVERPRATTIYTWSSVHEPRR
jgi:hypothetical protein